MTDAERRARRLRHGLPTRRRVTVDRSHETLFCGRVFGNDGCRSPVGRRPCGCATGLGARRRVGSQPLVERVPARDGVRRRLDCLADRRWAERRIERRRTRTSRIGRGRPRIGGSVLDAPRELRGRAPRPVGDRRSAQSSGAADRRRHAGCRHDHERARPVAIASSGRQGTVDRSRGRADPGDDEARRGSAGRGVSRRAGARRALHVFTVGGSAAVDRGGAVPRTRRRRQGQARLRTGRRRRHGHLTSCSRRSRIARVTSPRDLRRAAGRRAERTQEPRDSRRRCERPGGRVRVESRRDRNRGVAATHSGRFHRSQEL